ncbi:dimethylsulfonioproprionate lyase family protein [Rhizobium sp. CAU 1783]
MRQHLSDAPDWRYLVQEFHTLYSNASCGGSEPIRGHLRRVVDALDAVLAEDPEVLPRTPETRPVTAHLARALDLGARNTMAGLGQALARVRGGLTWEYGYAEVPAALASNYAYCEILGPQGPVKADGLILGFVLFAPDTVYPQHSHRDIEESYISVAGNWSQNDFGVHAPGCLVFNPPGNEHRITTGSDDPCLLAWAWIGPAERLAAPGMVFS